MIRTGTGNQRDVKEKIIKLSKFSIFNDSSTDTLSSNATINLFKSNTDSLKTLEAFKRVSTR